jgi:flagellar P-ring protein precursor FlgI
MSGGFKIVNEFPTIQQVTSALNAVGVTTREMMSILQEMKSVGALQAELIIK